MTILRDLRRFIEAKNIDGERYEIRQHVLAHVEELAPAFGTTPAMIVEKLEIVDDDELLATRLLATIKIREAQEREARRATKYERAQNAASAIANESRWVGDQLHIDLQSLLAQALTGRQDLLVFATEAFEVAVYMKPLLAIAQLKRSDVRGFVDAKGVHVRWATGGLSFYPQQDRGAERIVVSVCTAAESAA